MQCTIQHLHWKVDYLPQRIVGRPAVVADLFRNCDDGGDDDDVEGAEVEARWIGRRGQHCSLPLRQLSVSPFVVWPDFAASYGSGRLHVLHGRPPLEPKVGNNTRITDST